MNSLVANRTIYGGVLGRPEHLWVAFGDRATTFQKHCEYRRCLNQRRRLTRKATKIFEQNIAKDVRNNSKRFWKYAASKTKVKSKIPDLYTSDDESQKDMTENDQEKAEKLGSFFSSVFTNEVEGIWDIANKPAISLNWICPLTKILLARS